MSARARGAIVFLILLVAAFICIGSSFFWLPGAGVGVALPVIEVPGEVVVEDFLFGVDLTNTLIGTFLADILVLIFAVLAWRASAGWTKKVPGRFQALVEVLVDGLRGFFRGLAGDRLDNAPMLWPLVATIFIFLLAANWMKLLPGVETVGKMHCAHEGSSGYAMLPGWTDNSYRLWVGEPLNSGTSQTLEAEHACAAYFDEHAYEPFAVQSVEDIEAERDEAEGIVAELENTEDLSEEQVEELEHAHSYIEFSEARVASAEAMETYEVALVSIEEGKEALEGAEGEADDHAEEDDHGEEAEAAAVESEEADDHAEEDDHGEESTENSALVEDVRTSAASALSVALATEFENEDIVGDLQSAADSVATAADMEELESALGDAESALEAGIKLANTQMVYPGATLALSEDELDKGVVPFIFHVTPFVRGAATDLSLTFALAIMSVLAVQLYGIWALGPAYFDKFFNIPALGKLGENPMKGIDFVVGLIEIISEIGKIVSLAFRLFGNLFAGGVALMAVTFLIGYLVPGIILGLEVIIGAVQALVFAVLTLVFSAQAMEHHGDDHDHEHHEAVEHA